MSTLKTNTIATNNANNVSMDNSLKLKNYTTTERDALTSVAGDMIFNSTESKVQYYTGTEWINTGSADLIGDLEFIASMDYSSSSAGSGQNVLTTANGYMPVANIKFIYQGASPGYTNTASWFETSAEAGGFYVGGYTSASWLYKIHIYGVKG